MRDELFSGFSDSGWDQAPGMWNRPSLPKSCRSSSTPHSVAEAAERVGCVQRDVIRLRRTS